jgi:hypothetical protein
MTQRPLEVHVSPSLQECPLEQSAVQVPVCPQYRPVAQSLSLEHFPPHFPLKVVAQGGPLLSLLEQPDAEPIAAARAARAGRERANRSACWVRVRVRFDRRMVPLKWKDLPF